MSDFITDGDQQQNPGSNNNSMPGNHGAGATKAEIGRTERAATRRNKIFSSLMKVNVKEIDRTMKIALRQVDLQRQELYNEMDSLESRSGWLKDVEKASIASRRGKYDLSNSLIERSATFSVGTNIAQKPKYRRQQTTILYSQMSDIPEDSVPLDESALQMPKPNHLVRSHTDMSNSESPPLGIRKMIANNRSATSFSGAQDATSKARQPTSAHGGQVRFTVSGVDDIFGNRNSTPDALDEYAPNRDDVFSSPTLSVTRQSPSNRLLSSSTLSSQGRRKSLVYIPSSDSRYRLLNMPVESIDVRKIKEHSRSSQKLRIEGRHMLVKKNAKNGDSIAGGGMVDVGGEYIPKRVKMMREEQLQRRRESQEMYNKALVDGALAKFKELYVVPATGGLSEAKDFITALKQ